MRPSKLRTGQILNGRIGFYTINNPISFIEINKNNLNEFNLKLFQNLINEKSNRNI